MRACAALLVALACPGCLRVAWERQSRHTPVTSAALERLRPAEADLAACLAELGAPLWVWEHVEDGRASAVLAYGWYDQRDLGLRLSIPVYRALSASFEYDKIDERMRGAVLFFGPDWRLTARREGLLRDLTVELRPKRPQPVEEDA